ncbi:MAG TPA: pilus assembly protein TadG-related protein [Candidatus Sulfopaludibacter sp.]|nr:pilus assembly protein TadG-related protein [Candidatus Sulfopaludibacter sp.]
MAIRRSRHGFVLIVTCVALTILLGFAALAIDIARLYVIKSELQAFTDAAALGAALQLDGGEAGIEHAREAAPRLASGPHAMKWDLGTKPISDIAESFAEGSEWPDPRTWTTQPKDAGSYHFVRVTASAPAPLVFLRIFQPRDASTVAASSVAAKTSAAARLME